MLRKLVSLAIVIAITGPVVAQPAPKKADPKVLVTKVYDLKGVLGEKGKANGLADTDAVLKVVLEALPSLAELKPGTDGPQIIEREGGRLEVRATAATHEELKDLIEAMARLADVAVDVKAEVIELDAAAFEKLKKALPKPASPVLLATGAEFEDKDDPAWKALAELNKILKSGRVVQTSSGRFVNGAEATISARQSVTSYHPTVAGEKPPAGVAPQFAKEGFKLVGTPVVSADRRFVRFKLTEQSVVLNGIKTRELGVENGLKLVARSPELEDVGATGSATVADGGTLLFRLAYAPKDKVWVMVVRPTIFIQAEEELLKKEGKK